MITKKKETKKNTNSEPDLPRYTKSEISEASKLVLQEYAAEMDVSWDTVAEYCNITIGGLKALQKTLEDTYKSYGDKIKSSREKTELLLGITGGLKELFSECNEVIKEHSAVNKDGVRVLYTGKIDGEDGDLFGIGLISRYGSINEKLGQLMSIGYVELLASLTTSPEEVAMLNKAVKDYKQGMEEASNAGQLH